MVKLTPGINRLIDLIDSQNSHITVKKASDLLKKANLTEDDLKPWADYTHPIEDGYGRKMAYQTDNYEVMVMTWNPGDYSSVHDHGYTQWGAVQVFGNVMHQTFSNNTGVFRLTKKEILTNGSIIKVNNALIHQMGNVTTEPYLTLHMYGANEPHETVTADMKVYDLETKSIRQTSGGAFFNLTEQEAPTIGSLKAIDKETLVNYASVLMQFYCRYTPEKIGKQRQALLRQLENVVCDRLEA